MSYFVNHQSHKVIKRVDEPTQRFLNILMPRDTYKDGYTVCDIEKSKYYDLLKGSKLSFMIKNDSPYGYEHALAFKVGEVGAKRLQRDFNGLIMVKTRTNIFDAGNHSTQTKIERLISAGFRKHYKYLYGWDDAFIYKNESGNTLFTTTEFSWDYCLEHNYSRTNRIGY